MVVVRGDVLRPPHCTAPATWRQIKIKKWVPLRAMKTFIREKMDHTTSFRLIKPHQRPCNDPATNARGNILQFCEFQKLGCSFLQERILICLCNSPIWFDFLNRSMVQECLKHRTGQLSFLQNKMFQIVRFKALKFFATIFFSKLYHVTLN